MKNKDRVLGIFCLLLGIAFGAASMQLPKSTMEGDPGPKIFPMIAAAIFVLCGGALAIMGKPIEGKPFMTKNEWKRLLILYGVFVLYGVLLWLVGFMVAVPVILFIVCCMFSVGKPIPIWVKILYSAGISAAIWFIFTHVLNMLLPAGLLFS